MVKGGRDSPPAKDGNQLHADRIRRRKPRAARFPFIWSPRTGSRDAGLDDGGGRLGEGQRLHRRGRPRRWSCPARTARSPARCSGSARRWRSGALGFGALAKALPEGDWHFATTLDDPTLAALGLVLGGYASPATARSRARALRLACRRAPTRRASSASPTASSWPATSSTRRPTTWGRTRWRRPCATLAETHKAKVSVITGDDLLDAEFPDDPCRRPRLRRSAAADRHGLGRRRTRRR